MARLCAADYDRILVFLREAHAAGAEEPLPLRIVEWLRELVPSAAVTYREWEGGRSKTVLAADEPDEWLSVWSAYGFVRAQDPFPGGPGPAAEREHAGRPGGEVLGCSLEAAVASVRAV